MVNTYATNWGGRKYTTRAASEMDARWHLMNKLPGCHNVNEIGDVWVETPTPASSYGAFGRYDH